jgi:hypothetical protein
MVVDGERWYGTGATKTKWKVVKDLIDVITVIQDAVVNFIDPRMNLDEISYGIIKVSNEISKML